MEINRPAAIVAQQRRLSWLPLHLFDAANHLARRSDGLQTRNAADWLAESRRHLLSATRDPVRGGPHSRRSDLSRQAGLELAAGAALNGLLLAASPSAQASAQTLLARILYLAGDTATAGKIVANGEVVAADLPPELLRRKTSSASVMADAAPALLKGASVGPWAMRCDNTLTCTAINTQSTGKFRWALVVTRAAGPAASAHVDIVLEQNPGEGPLKGSLQVGGAARLPIRFLARQGVFDGRPSFAIPPAWVGELVDVLAKEGPLTLQLEDDPDAQLHPVAGARDVLRFFDQAQGRNGLGSALIERGQRRESRVPLAPVPREIVVPAVEIHEVQAPVPEDVKAFWRHTCREAVLIERPADEGLRPVSLSLHDGTEIWLLPCRSGASRMQYQLFYRVDGNLQSLTHPYRFNGVEPPTRLLQNPLLVQFHPEPLGDAWRRSGDGRFRSQPAPGRWPLFLIEQKATGSPAASGCQTHWAWNGKWFERVFEECLPDQTDAFLSIRSYRDRLICE